MANSSSSQRIWCLSHIPHAGRMQLMRKKTYVHARVSVQDLERGVAVALQTGQNVVVKAGEYHLKAPLVVAGKLHMRTDGGTVRINGTCVLAGAGSGGHIKGVEFVGQGGMAPTMCRVFAC